MAAPFIRVEVSEAQRQELEAVLTPSQVRRAMFQAVLRTTNSGRVQVDKRVREEININKKYSQRAITAVKPAGDNPVGIIRISRYPIPLIAYRPRISRKGATVTISKKKPPITFRHAFAATVKSRQQREQGLEGHKGVFLRAFGRTKGVFVGETGRAQVKAGGRVKGLTPRGYAWRLPIEEQMGPSVLSVFGEEGTRQVAREELTKLHDLLDRNLRSQMDRFLNRKKGETA